MCSSDLKTKAQNFISQILNKKLSSKFIFVSNNFRFGNKREGNVKLLKKYEKLFNYKVVKPEPLIKIDATRNKKEQKRDKYRNNKNDGIEITKYYIKNNDILNNYFIKHKKKDDLADTLLQTISYIKKNNAELIIEEVNISDNNLIDI